MAKSLASLIEYLKGTNIFLFVAINVAIILIFQGILGALLTYDTEVPIEIKKLQESKWEFFILSIIIGPLLETLIFQKLVIQGVNYLLLKIKLKSIIIPIIISAIVFGAQHFYNIGYVINGFFVGVFLALAYTIISSRNGHAFIVVTIIHSIVNFIPFCRDFIIS